MHADGSLAKRRRVMAALMLASAMAAADATIANVILPSIEREFGAAEFGAWIVTGYLVAAAAVTPLTGWLRRRYGAQSLFTHALLAFMLASVLCAASPSPSLLVAFRVLQGTAGGLLIPLAQVLVLEQYPVEKRAQAQSLWSAAAVAGPVAGAVLGGALAEHLSWKAVFLINVPLCLAAVALATGRLPSDRWSIREPVDVRGLVLLSAAIVGIELALDGVGPSLLETAVAIAAGGAFVRHSLRRSSPIVSVALLRDRNLFAASAGGFILAGAILATIAAVPLLMQGPLGYGATAAGVAISPRAIAMVLTMTLLCGLVQRVEPRLLLCCGAGLSIAALETLALLPADDELRWSWIIASGVLQGVGGGLALPMFGVMACSTLPVERRTEGAGIYYLSRQIGSAALAALALAMLHGAVELEDFTWTFHVLAAIAALLVPLLLVYRREPARRPVAAS